MEPPFGTAYHQVDNGRPGTPGITGATEYGESNGIGTAQIDITGSSDDVWAVVGEFGGSPNGCPGSNRAG